MQYLDEQAESPRLDVVRIVCLDERERVLLVQEVDDSNWKLPGGKVEAGETIFEAVQRELEEELGVTVTRDNLKKIVKKHIPESPNYRYILLAHLDNLTIKPTDEVAQSGYYEVTNLPETKFSHHIQSAVGFVK